MTSPTSVATNINLTQAVDTTPATTARAENNANLTPTINITCLPTTLTHDTEVINQHQTDDNYSPLLRRQLNNDLYREITNISNIESWVDNNAMICLPCNAGEEDYDLVDTDSEEGDIEEDDDRDSMDDFIVNDLEDMYSDFSDMDEDDPLDSDYSDNDVDEEERRLTDDDERTFDKR